MKKILGLAVIISTLWFSDLNAQVVSGKVYNLMKWPEIVPIVNAQVEISDETKTKTTWTDSQGNYTIDMITGITDKQETPTEFKLEQNYPNPFNPHTTIQYTLQNPSRATIKIWDIQGREIKTLFNNEENTGTHSVTWDATNNEGVGVASGIYIYTLTTNNGTTAKKMAYIKGINHNNTRTITNNQTNNKQTNKIPKTTNTKILNIKITSPETWERETKIKTNNNDNTTQDFDVLTKADFPDSLMTFYNSVANRTAPITSYSTVRLVDQLSIYITADTTTTEGKHFYEMIKNKITQPFYNDAYKTPLYPEGFWKNIEQLIQVGVNPPADNTPGYMIIRQEEIGNYVALSNDLFDFNTGIIYFSRTRYAPEADDRAMDKAITKETTAGFGRNNNQKSMWNSHADDISKDFQLETDRKMNRFMYARPPMNKMPDKDNGWDYELKKPLE